MKKNPSLYGIFTAVIMVLCAVSSAGAVDSKYFCFKEATVDSKKVLYFSQHEAASTSEAVLAAGASAVCLEDWYNADGSGAYTYAQDWLDKNNGSGVTAVANPRTIVLTSDIEFAGKTTDGNGDVTCNDASNAFKGIYLELGKLDSIRSENGKRWTISGLCYDRDDITVSNMGFVKIADAAAVLENVAFSDVYFDLSSSGVAGILFISDGVDFPAISNIAVKNSVFKAPDAAAIAGLLNNVKKITNIDIDNVSVNAGTYSWSDAGAVVGRVYTKNSLVVSNIKVSNTLVNGTEAGGIFGLLCDELGSSEESLRKVQLSNIAVGGSVKGATHVGGLVGSVYLKKSITFSAENAKVLADVQKESEDGNSAFLGSLLGYVQTENSGTTELSIKNTFSKGSVEETSSTDYTGYLIGGVYNVSHINFNLIDNYHYGINDASAKYGVGGWCDHDPSLNGCSMKFFSEDKWGKSFSVGADGSVMERNFRNAIKNKLDPNGALLYGPQPIKNGGKSYSNGVLSSEDMKSRRFAAVLNMNGGNWTIDEGENDGLPIFKENASNVIFPILPIFFNIDSFNKTTADLSHRNKLNAAIEDGSHPLEYINANSDGIVLFTNINGRLLQEDVEFVKELLGAGAYWETSSGSEWQFTDQAYRQSAEYTYKAPVSLDVAYHFCTANDGNNGCDYNSSVKILDESEGNPVEGFDIGYWIPPVLRYEIDNPDTLIPSLIVRNGESVFSYHPVSYRIYSKTSSNPNVDENVPSTSSGKFIDFDRAVTSLDFINDYDNTIHLYYVNGVNKPMDSIRFTNGTTLPVYVNGLVYDSAGVLRKKIYDGNINKIPNNDNKMLPVVVGFTLEPEIGYSLSDWNLSFKFYGKTSSSTPIVDNKHIVEIDDFVRNYESKTWRVNGLSASDTIYLDSICKGVEEIQGAVATDSFVVILSPRQNAKEYKVTFDMSRLLDDENALLVFSDSERAHWQSSLYVTNVKTATNMPDRAYLFNDAKFYEILWSNEDLTAAAYRWLSPELLKAATGGDASVQNVTLYAKPGTSDIEMAPINIYAYKDGKVLTNASDYHGTIELSQTVGGKKISQKSRWVEGQSIFRRDYTSTVEDSPKLLLPYVQTEDWTFDVAVEADPGYEMKIDRFNYGWDANVVVDENYGYESSTNQLKISANMIPGAYNKIMWPEFVVQFIPYHYNIDFSIPSDMLSNDELFVANAKDENGKILPDWFLFMDNVSADSVHVPSLYNSNGCRVGWVASGLGIAAHLPTGNVADEYKYMTTADTDALSRNTLVASSSNQCSSGFSNVVRSNPTEHGKLYLLQQLNMGKKSNGEDSVVVLRHALDGNNNYSLNVPNAGPLGITFVIEAVPDPGYIFDVIGLDKSIGGATVPAIANNGDTLTVIGDVFVSQIKFEKLKPAYVAYDLALSSVEDAAKVFLPADAVAADSLEIASSKDDVPLWTPYRTDKCFGGWKDASGSVHTSLNATNYIDFSKDETKPTVLSAVWETCTTERNPTIVLKNGNNDVSLTLYQLFGADTLCFEIPSEGVGLQGGPFDIYVDKSRVKTKAGYRVDEGPVLENATKVGDAWRVQENASAKATYTFKTTVKPVEYSLVFNENAGTSANKPFFGDAWTTLMTKAAYGTDAKGNWTVKVGYNVENTNLAFPKALYREGYCLQGYTLKADDATDGVYSELNMDLVNLLEQNGAATSTTMFAYWKSCDVGTDIAVENSDKGTFKFTRKFDLGDGTETKERVYETTSGKLRVPSDKDDISFTGISFNLKEGAGVLLDSLAKFSYQKKGESTWTEIADGLFTVTSDMKSIKAPLLNSVYAFDFNRNASEKVFYGTNTIFEPEYAYGDKLPLDIYRTDAKMVGWSFNANAKASDEGVFSELNDKFLAAYDKHVANRAANAGDTLYAVWKLDSSIKYYTVTTNSGNMGTLTLTQKVGESSFAYAVSDQGLRVPVVDGGIEFFAHFEADPAWNLESRPLVWKTSKSKDSTENNVARKIKSDVSVKVLASLKEIHLVFDANSSGTMFYGSDWKKNGDYGAGNASDNALPTMVYNADSCLAGWSVKSGTSYTVVDESLFDELYSVYPDLDLSKDVNLKAIWTGELSECAGKMTRIAIEQDHGRMDLVEKVGKSKSVHKFNKKGTMMIPLEIESDSWTFTAEPDSSFVLDSVVVLRQGKKVAVLHEGEHLPKNMENVVLKAYFGKANKTPIELVKTEFRQSGNAVQVNFASSEFEVTRGVSANIQIVDRKTNRAVVDSLLGDSVETGFSKSVVLHVLPGDYKLELTLKDDTASASYVKNFSVKSVFASFAPESWSMISMVAVDTSAIAWDENPHFYWWDDAHCGPFWQYKMFNRGDEIEASRGVWYSSEKGSSLALRSDIEDYDSDIVWKLDSVASGWNLVANTHGWRVNVYSKSGNAKNNADEESEIEFWRYNPETGGYDEDVEYLEPYEAIWVKVNKPMTWKISGEPDFVSEANDKDVDGRNLEKSLAKAASVNRWSLRAAVADGNGKRDSWNLLGVSDHPFDAEEPPASMGDHVNLSIVDGNRGLAKSIKSPSDDLEWTIALTASSIRNGYLTIDGIAGVQSLGYKVYVTVYGETVEMQEGKSLPLLLKSSSTTATVRVTKGAPVLANKALIKGLRWTNVGNKLHVVFEAPENLAGANARVELLDVKGKVKATASAKTLWGTNALTLDAPQSGLLVLRVRVGSEQQVRKIHLK